MTRAFFSIILISAIALAVDTRPAFNGSENIVSGDPCDGNLQGGWVCPVTGCGAYYVYLSVGGSPEYNTPTFDYNCNSKFNGSGAPCGNTNSYKNRITGCVIDTLVVPN